MVKDGIKNTPLSCSTLDARSQQKQIRDNCHDKRADNSSMEKSSQPVLARDLKQHVVFRSRWLLLIAKCAVHFPLPLTRCLEQIKRYTGIKDYKNGRHRR